MNAIKEADVTGGVVSIIGQLRSKLRFVPETSASSDQLGSLFNQSSSSSLLPTCIFQDLSINYTLRLLLHIHQHVQKLGKHALRFLSMFLY